MVSILTFSIGAAYYLGIYDTAAALLPTLLGLLALDKLTAALPFGTKILFHLGAAEQLLTISIAHTFKGIVFMLEGVSFTVEFGLSLIELLIDKQLTALYLRK